MIGVAWSFTGPLAKLAVSTGHHPIGIAFWNVIIAVALLSAVLAVRRTKLTFTRKHIAFFAVCSILGTVLPNTLSYWAYNHLPIGVIMLVLSLVPMATMLMALPLRLEKPQAVRLLGILFGIIAVAFIALPETSLPHPEQAIWVLLPVIVSVSYAAENIVIAVARPDRCDSLTILCGFNWAALIFLFPILLVSDAWFDLYPFGVAEQATLAISIVHIAAYFGFIWLVTRAGPVFAAQVGYVVTGSGVLLGIILFGEQHSWWIWTALVLMMAGLVLVHPNEREVSQ